MVQLNVWSGTKWINVFDGNDFKNMNIDLHRVAKVVEDQVAEIEKAVKRANDAMDQANQAVDASNVNKTAVSDVEKAANEAKQNIADALKKVTNLGTQVNKNQTDIEQTKESVALKADQTAVDDIKKTATDNAAAVQVLSNEVKSKVDSTTVNKIIDDKGYTTAETAQALIDQTADKISSTITNLKTTVDKNGKLISSTSDQLSNFTQTLDGLQTTVKNKASQDQLTQLSDQLTAKVSTKDYQSEIALLNKNINARISKGDVISQLNLEAGGDGLIQVANGKGKLLIDADSTVINGKAFIPSAAITDIQADKITSGTLNAGKIKVINLTADNIVGGTLDVGSMKVKNFSADMIRSGTLEGVSIKSGTADEYFQTVKDAIIWKKLRDSSVIGTTEYAEKELSPLNIFDTNYIQIGTFAGAEVENGEVKAGGNLGHPRITVADCTAFDPLTGNSTDGRDNASQIVLWLNKEEFVNLTVGNELQVHLNSGKATAYNAAWAGTSFIIQKDDKIGAYFGRGDKGNNIDLVTAGGSININGPLNVTGAKHSVVQTSQGWQAINAYETAEYYFGDLGESNTSDSCKTIIGIDRVFKETVNTDIQYQVYVTPYSNATVWVEERHNNRFVVCSDKPNVEFGWEIKAKRKGHENDRLEKVEADFTPTSVLSKGDLK